MKILLSDEPREFEVGNVTIRDHGKISLDSDDMITILSKDGNECDITAKEWGLYLGPSLNGRLKNQGYKAALVLNEYGKIFVNAVEKEKIEIFKKYLKDQNSVMLCWLDEWIDDKE